MEADKSPLDRMAKLRDVTVNLDDVERRLARHPSVKEAAVVAVLDPPEMTRMIAFVVVANSKGSLPAALREFIKRSETALPTPSVFITVEQIPKTSDGGKDYQSLRTLSKLNLLQSKSDDFPNSQTQVIVLAMFAELLEEESLGVSENFFDLGGHSLAAQQLVSSLADFFGIDVPVSKLEELGSVTELASYIDEQKIFAPADSGSRAIVPDPKAWYDPFPLTDIQAAYLLGRSANLVAQAAHRYFEIEAIGLDTVRFEKAWQRLIQRHGMLRAVIRPDGQQQILETVPEFLIPVTDLRNRDSRLCEDILGQSRDELSHQVFKVDQWPLFEIRVHLLKNEVARIHFSFDLLMCDGKSFRILLTDLSKLYADPEISLAPLTISFRDVVLSGIEGQKSEKYKASLKYWMDRVPLLPRAPNLPIFKNLNPDRVTKFRRRTITLDQTKWAELQRRAAEMRLTTSSLLLAAYSEVLYTWSKEPQFTINMTALNRRPLSHPQVNDIAGDFTTLNLLAVDMTSGSSFLDRARKIQNQLWRDLDHDEVCGIHVLRELARLRPDETASGVMPVVFTSMLNVHTNTGAEILKALNGKYVFRLSQTPQVWLDHQVFEEEGNLVIVWDAVDEIFREGVLDAMFAEYCGFLRRLASGLQDWNENPLLVPDEQSKMIAVFNRVETSEVSGTLFELFSAEVPRRPEHLALICGESRITYQELFNLSETIAGKLSADGVNPRDFVAVIMEKGWEQVAAVLGILRAGAVYLPIDPDFPAERIRFLLDHAGAKVALVQPKREKQLSALQGLATSTVSRNMVSVSREQRAPSISPKDLAYVIYTSGSTGTPKGVAVSHQAAVNTILDINERQSICPGDRVFALSALSFDLSVYDIFGTLAAGATIVMPGAEGVNDPGYWLEQLIQHKVTIWNSAPALMKVLTDSMEGPVGDNGLRLVLLSGDWIPVNLPDKIRTCFRNVKVVSLGGATEASIWSIEFPIDAVDPKWRSIPYGKPLKNQFFRVFDEMLRPRPIWVPGNLFIGGIGLAEEYWRDPQRTNQSFIHHPKSGERLYKTGDLGRYLPDGNIEFLGREDFQVKVQGYRIELGEIESALERHAYVERAIADVIGPRDDERAIAVFVVKKKECNVESEDLKKELKTYLRQKLPAYMIPTQVLFVDKIPLTANGKSDRKELKKLIVTELSGILPQGVKKSRHWEETVAALFAEVLTLPKVRVEANFFDLGANSIKLIGVQTRLKAKFGIQVPIADFFKFQTISGFAKHIMSETNPRDSQAEIGAKVKLELGDMVDFKLREPSLRHDLHDRPAVALARPELSVEWMSPFTRRRSHRSFAKTQVSFGRFSEFLACLMQVRIEDYVLAKYQYPSAGSFYPVQTYIYVKPDRIENVQSGLYYLDPKEHRLLSIADQIECDFQSLYSERNSAIVDASAFSIFLVGSLLSLVPTYGDLARDFCLLEAGYMGQLLMMNAANFRIGLCPIGRFNFEEIRSLFMLNNGGFLAHSFVGGDLEPGTFAKTVITKVNSENQGRKQKTIQELKREAVLETSITGYRKSWQPRLAVNSGNVLLTGSTGFLGSHLLADLLQSSDLNITCLVRAELTSAKASVKEKLESYNLFDAKSFDRIKVVQGDISKPLLGLKSDEFITLASDISSIYHAGAWVNHLFSYEELRNTNVNSTKEVLRLACEGALKQVFFISTITVGVELETSSLEDGRPLQMGYCQSKWVAEKLCIIARERGIPVTIFRPDLLTWSTQTGASNATQVECLFIRSIVELGLVPEVSDLERLFPCLTPVDFASKAIINLSLQQDDFGKTYHVVTPEYTRWGKIVGEIEAFGYGLRKLPYAQWLAELKGHHARNGGSHSELLIALLEREDESFSRPQYSTELLQAALEKTNVRCLEAEGSVNKALAYLVVRGLIRSPRR